MGILRGEVQGLIAVKCPHCGAVHEADAGRFCKRCGLSVPQPTGPAAAPAKRPAQDDEPKTRCPMCGMLVSPPLCPNCGIRIGSGG